MKKLLIFLVIAGCYACNCIGQLPIQVLPVDDNCMAILPDYREHITVKDNCVIRDTLQIPVPGTILDASNPFVNVVIVVTDISNNQSSINFDVVIDDNEPPTIEIDSSYFFTYTAEERSGLLHAYKNSLGYEMHQAGGKWKDTFDNKPMLMVWNAGFNASTLGMFFEQGRSVMTLDSSHLEKLGFTHTIAELRFMDAVCMPSTIDAAGYNDDYYTMYAGGTVGPKDIPGLNLMYQSERYGAFDYNIPVGSGKFKVILHFAEIYWTEPGKRIFDVLIENELVLDEFDILSEVLPNSPLDKIFYIDSGFNGMIDISFTYTVDFAKISGITIEKISGLEANLSIIN